MSALAAMHVAKKQLGLDEETYRAVLVRVTGKESAKTMSEAERNRVVEEFRKQGFKKASKAASRAFDGPFAKKLQALWIGAWNLGLVRDRGDQALTTFIKRQTGIDAARFLRNAHDAAHVIEPLKAWMARDAGVDWTVDRLMPTFTQIDGYRIARAQFKILRRQHPDFARFNELQSWMVEALGQGRFASSTSAEDWIGIMNTLGKHVREVKA
ncbi:regulatory protein GemA [Aliihoeflea sp. PC F10.4]